MHFLINPVVRYWLFGVQTVTPILLIGFQIKSNVLIMADHVTYVFVAFLKSFFWARDLKFGMLRTIMSHLI